MSTQQGYFLVADITGYTQYLSASELDHAQKILTALLNLLIGHTKPPLVISRLAGDAVISYGLREGFVEGQTLVEMLEDTYVSFRRTIELMVRNTTCTCNACRNIKSLDLKFFVHFGMFAIQRLDAHDELVGSDVNLVHRLLKNHVTEATGLKAYTLYTEAAIEQLGLTDELAHLVRLEESYEHFEPVGIAVQDMHPVWEKKRREAQISITPKHELFRASADINLSPERVWNYLLQPFHYNVLVNASRIEITARRGARVAPGSAYQCYHGDAQVSLTIVEWQPFERMVSEYAVPIPIPNTRALSELRLEPLPGGGCRLSQIFGKATGSLPGRLMGDAAFRSMKPKFEQDMANFKRHVEADFAAHGGSVPASVPLSDAMIASAARESLAALA